MMRLLKRGGEADKREKVEGSKQRAASRAVSAADHLRPSTFCFSPHHLVTASPRPSEKGWTLIELVITMTVLAILTTGVIPLVKTAVKRQREQQLRDELREMREAIKEFHRDTIGMQCAGGIGGAATTGLPLPPTGPAPNPAQGPPMPYVDPRSKVVISDCTIFGVDNPDHYPPKLETLVEGVNVTPRVAPISAGIGGAQATDNKLVSQKKKVYLRAIPMDPMTGKAEWDLRSTYDTQNAGSWGGENVFDVRSKSSATALNGEKYSDW